MLTVVKLSKVYDLPHAAESTKLIAGASCICTKATQRDESSLPASQPVSQEQALCNTVVIPSKKGKAWKISAGNILLITLPTLKLAAGFHVSPGGSSCRCCHAHSGPLLRCQQANHIQPMQNQCRAPYAGPGHPTVLDDREAMHWPSICSKAQWQYSGHSCAADTAIPHRACPVK